MPYNPEELSSTLESEPSRMEFVDGHPICGKCLSDNHEHPFADEAHGKGLVDCKNADVIDGKPYQCHCGLEGWYKNKKWVSWGREEEKLIRSNKLIGKNVI
ncbi:hypothetical protein MYX06_02600 [Patescibacteria group bacterium AH-259-L05]|nr:hypothetical protein [Patescibacteria group bacterium AH-259-L05]